jgi:hypothetical protein
VAAASRNAAIGPPLETTIWSSPRIEGAIIQLASPTAELRYEAKIDEGIGCLISAWEEHGVTPERD